MATPNQTRNSADLILPILSGLRSGAVQAGQSAVDKILSALTPEGAKAMRDKTKRDRLKALGLNKDQIDAAIAAENARPAGQFPTAGAMKQMGFSDAEVDNAIAATPTPQNQGPVGDAMKMMGFSDAEVANAIAATPVYPTEPAKPAAPTASSEPTPTAPATPSPEATARRRTALEMGAPSGREESREFARGLFAKSQMAQQELDRYRKANPKADANDPTLMRLQSDASMAATEAQAGVQWATMTPSARQSVLTQEDMAAKKNRAAFMTKAFADEQAGQQLEAQAGRRNLIEDGKYYNETGVMRGGAGVGTSTTRAGGVISAPDASGNRTLTSPYGTGSITYLTPEQMKTRPQATFDAQPAVPRRVSQDGTVVSPGSPATAGKPASQFFDEAAMRQGRTFTVGGATYSPEMSPADRAQKDLDEQKRKAEEERKKFAAQTMK